MRLRSATWLGIVGLALLAAACGGASSGIHPEGPLTVEQQALFDDGVDLLTDPNALQDTWRSDWERQTQQIVAQSDLIFVGTITTVRSQEDLGRKVSHHVVINTERTLAGTRANGEPPRGEQVLVSREGCPGYAALAARKDQLLRLRVVAFVKYANEGGVIVPHFHLTMPSKPIFAAVDQREGSGHEVRIVEHTQK